MDLHRIAKKRVKKRRNFFISLTLWPIISGILFFINMMTFTDEWWAIYPFAIWGIGLFFQAIDTFGYGRAIEEWENKRIRKKLKEEEPDETLDLNVPRKELQKQKNWDDSELV